MKTKVGTTLYLGVKRNIISNSQQSADLRFNKHDGFLVSTSVAAEFSDIQRVIDDYCGQQIRSYIDRGINNLRSKKIKTTVPYTDGKTTFDKEVELSVDEYLDLYGFSRKLEYEIGPSTQEWGINTINVDKKIFTLYFSLNLIKYDDGPHINHVVAHELAHVFVRDHSPKFQDVLRQLDPSSNWSQSFFNSGIGSVGTTKSLIPLLLVLGGIIISYGVYWLYMFVAGLVNFSGSSNF